MKKILMSFLFLFVFPNFSYAASWEIQQARQEYAAGNYTKALKTITHAVETDSNLNIEAHKLRAKIHLKLNDKYSAIEDYTAVIEIQPDAEMYIKRARLCAQVKSDSLALKDITRSVSSLGDKRNVVIDELKAIANDSEISTKVKMSALSGLNSIYKNMYGRESLEAFIPLCRKVKLAAYANEDDEIFIEANMSKQEFLDSMINLPRKESNGKMSQRYLLVLELKCGYFKYASGDKELGLKIINGALSELKLTLQPDIQEAGYLKMLEARTKTLNAIDSDKI